MKSIEQFCFDSPRTHVAAPRSAVLMHGRAIGSKARRAVHHPVRSGGVQQQEAEHEPGSLRRRGAGQNLYTVRLGPFSREADSHRKREKTPRGGGLDASSRGASSAAPFVPPLAPSLSAMIGDARWARRSGVTCAGSVALGEGRRLLTADADCCGEPRCASSCMDTSGLPAPWRVRRASWSMMARRVRLGTTSVDGSSRSVRGDRGPWRWKKATRWSRSYE
mmetsp:Transcript_5346/g.18090  ORF Transcript_5346/g.18090 Transcript_5346/m.18090 type:complete len:221 (+) Transcript_5346:1638-2300(+)